MTQPQSQDMPPQMQAMMAQQGEMMGEAFKNAIILKRLSNYAPCKRRGGAVRGQG